MTDNSRPAVTPSLRTLAATEAEAIAQDVGGIRAVVIATADGFEVASCIRSHVEPERIAALASSIAAIGAVVSAEARLGRSTSVTVATDNGFAVVHTAMHREVTLVINVIAGQDTLLAHVNHRVAACARLLGSA